MNHSTHNMIVSFIWNVADDVLRDVYVRGKYRDVILPMTVIRRLDALLEPRKEAVLQQKAMLDGAEIVEQEAALKAAADKPFFNTSPFTLKNLLDNPKQLRANFIAYLDGYSSNVQEIVEKFNFRDQLRKLEQADVLYQLIEKFLNPAINLSPEPVLNAKGEVRLPGLSNLGMGYVFEELLRKFNEENNEEAGEHFTPREIVRLMTKLIIAPVADDIKSGSYLVYDCACGTGGMLTEADAMLQEQADEHNKEISVHLYGQEVNDETYAIAKADLLIKGEGEGNISYGSTLSMDAFPGMEFDFMLANPPYGKSWKTDLERLAGGNKKDMMDPRFVVSHDGNPEFNLVTRSSDGQMMFLVNMLSKMKETGRGSRVATVHNGSALFTGDAGQGESNIRQWILENDYLEAIIGLPLNLFYNTGIATYIWVLSNHKAPQRRGKVQLIDATEVFTKLRKNLGHKNCELSEAQIEELVNTYLDFEDEGISKIFDTKDFGYWKITVERPLRLSFEITQQKLEELGRAGLAAKRVLSSRIADQAFTQRVIVHLAQDLGTPRRFNNEESFIDYLRTLLTRNPIENLPNLPPKHFAFIASALDRGLEGATDNDLLELQGLLQGQQGASFSSLHAASAAGHLRAYFDSPLEMSDKQLIALARRFFSEPDEQAEPIIKKRHKDGSVEYEPDSNLRDTENVPLKDDIQAYFEREVLPHVPSAWIDHSKTRKGYEISFTKYFYKYQPLRSLEEIKADILRLETETDGVLKEIVEA